MGDRILVDLRNPELREEYCPQECDWRKLYDSHRETPTTMTPERCGQLAAEAGLPANCGLAAMCIEVTAKGNS